MVVRAARAGCEFPPPRSGARLALRGIVQKGFPGRRVRVEKARNLLLNPHLRVDEIAYTAVSSP